LSTCPTIPPHLHDSADISQPNYNPNRNAISVSTILNSQTSANKYKLWLCQFTSFQ